MMLLLYHHSPYHHHRRKTATIADLSIAIIKLFILLAFNNRSQTLFTCEAKPASLVLLPSPSPSSPLEDPIQHEALHRIAKASRVVNITRQHGGDVLRTNGKFKMQKQQSNHEENITFNVYHGSIRCAGP